MEATAGVSRPARVQLHDARHTPATVLLILGQPEGTVMSLMGWSTSNMTKRYQHVTDTVRTDVASQVGDLIWAAKSEDRSARTVAVRQASLGTILPLVERGLLDKSHNSDVDIADLEEALADLRTALSAAEDTADGGAK